MIRAGCNATSIGAELLSDQGRKTFLGVQREPGRFIARSGGVEINRRSELIRRLPVVALTQSSHKLIEEGPELRRRFLDEALFHVEHDYHEVVKSYVRAIKQRNKALKTGDTMLARSFHPSIVSKGERITKLRERFVQRLIDVLPTQLENLGASFDSTVEYRRGWKEGNLLQALDHHLSDDLRLGYSTVGPHRADLKITIKNRHAAKVLSRGQQKILVYGLVFSSMMLMKKEPQIERPVVLIDDLPAELDKVRISAVLDWLGSQPFQVFMTALQNFSVGTNAVKMFHVEQGKLY